MAFGNEVIGRPDGGKGATNNGQQTQQVQQIDPLQETVNILGEPSQLNEEGIPVYNYLELSRTYDNDHIAWASKRSEYLGGGVDIVMPSFDDYLANAYKQNNVDPNSGKVPILMNGKQIKNSDGTIAMKDNPAVIDVYNNAQKEWSDIQANYNKYAKTVDYLTKNPEHYNQLTDIYNKEFFGYRYTKNEAAKINSGQVTSIVRDFSDMSPEDQARDEGYVFNAKTGEYEDYDSWDFAKDRLTNTLSQIFVDHQQNLQNFWNVPTFGLTETISEHSPSWFNLSLLLPGYALSHGTEALFKTILPEKTLLTTSYNPYTDSYELMKRSAYDRTISSSEIYGVFGKSNNDNVFQSFFGNLYNFINPVSLIANISGWSSQWVMDLEDNLTKNEKDKNFYTEDYSSAISSQNFAVSASYTPSYRAAEQPWSTEAVFGYMGAAVGITFQIMATRGASLTNIAPGSSLWKFVPRFVKDLGIGLLSAQETAAFNQTLNDMGMPRELAVYALPTYFTMTSAIESIGSNILFRESKLGSKVFAKEIIDNTVGVNKASTFKRFMKNVMWGRPENFLQGALTVAPEEMIEEGLQAIGTNLYEAAFDYSVMNDYYRDKTYNKFLHDNKYIPVDHKATFNDPSSYESFSGIMGNIGEGVLNAALIGAISSLPMSGTRALVGRIKGENPSMYYQNDKQKTIFMGVLNGQDQQLFEAAEITRKQGRFGSTVYDINGKPKPASPKEGEQPWMSENDFIYNNVVNEITLAQQLKTNIPQAVVSLLNQDMTLVSDLMGLKNTISTKQSEINALTVEQDQKGIDNTGKINELNEQLIELNRQMDEFIKPEYEGSKYSKKFNDKFNSLKSSYVFARNYANYLYAKEKGINVNDITERDIISKEYGIAFINAKNSIDEIGAIASRQRTANAKTVMNNHNNSMRLMYGKKGETAQKNVESLLSEIEGIKSKAFESPSERLSAIVNTLSRSEGMMSDMASISQLNPYLEEDKRVDMDQMMKKAKSAISSLGEGLGDFQYGETEDIFEMLMSANPISPNAPQVEYPMRAAELESDKDVLNAKAIESYIGYFNDLNIEEAKESLSKLTPENEARYLNSMEHIVSSLEVIAKNGVKNSLRDFDAMMLEINEALNFLELSSKVAKHDRFANDAFFSQEGTKELQHKDDYRLDKEQYESVMNNLIAYNKRVSDVLEKVYSEKGVGDHNIISALHARVQVNFYRDMFTKGMTIGEDVVNKVGTITEYLENSLGTDKYNTFKNLLLAVIKQEKTADGKMRGRFDYSKKDIVNPAYEENGVTKGILSEEGMRTTEELQTKIFNLEGFIKENGNVFFSKEAIDLTVSNLNNAMHALGGETFINLNNPLKILRDNVMENYGYFNSNFDNAALGITAVDLLKASAIIDSSTGEGSLIKSPGEIHGAEVKTGKLYEDIKYIDSETVNSFNYKWAINYLSMLAGSSTHEMYSEQLDRFNSVKANDGQVYTTFEQMLALGQIGAFFNGGNRVFRDVIDAEAKFFKTKYDSIKQELKKRNRDKELDEGGSIERSLFEANMRFVENAITLTGDLGAGKTEILRYALDKIVAKKVANKEVVSISILANNNDLYSKNFKFVNDYLKNKYPEIKLEINNQFMDTRNILTQEGLGDLVIIDEAGLMKDTFFSDPKKGDNDIKKLFKVGGRQLLMIADEYQVTELARDNGTSALKAGMVTIPLTERFRSGIAITNTVADFFRNMIAQKKASINDLSVSDLQMPAVNHKVNEDGTKIGVKYNTSVRDVVNEFLNDNTEVSKALIIPNVDYLQYSDYEPLRAKDSQGRYITDNDGKYLIDDKYKNEVRIIIDDLSAKAQQVPSIQGMDAEHVYVAIDYMWIIQNEKEWSWRIAPKAMYTSVGRVADKGRGANYVSLIGNTAELAGDEVLTKLSPNKGRNIENEKKYLQNLVNKTTRQTIQQQDNSNSPETSLPRIVDDIFVNDGYFYTGKSKNLQKSYFAGKPKGALYTSRLTVEDGAITEHIDEFKIDVLKNKKIGKSYIARFFKDGNGKITEARLYAYNEDGEKSSYEFKTNLSGNLTEMFDTLSNGNKNNKRLFEVIGVHGSEISNGQFNVPSMMLPLSHWKNVVEGNADYAVVEYLKNNKDIIVDVFYDESQTGEAVLTYENKKFYVSHYDMFKAEVREEVSYDDAVNLVNGTLTRSRVKNFHTNIVRKTLANQQAEPSTSANSVPGTENSFEDTSIIRTNTIEVTLDSAIDDNGSIKVVTGLQTSTNKNSNDALIELTDANGISETVSVNKFEEILQTQVSRNKDAYQGNEEKSESKITSGKRTGLVKDGKANSPIYFYGRSVYAGPRMSEVPDADKEAVSYLIQNVKQAVLRRGSQFGFTNKRVVLVKDFSYLSDNNAIVNNDIAVVLKGDLNVNVQTILAVKNDDSEYIKNLKQNYLELYNKYSDAVNESLSIISVSEDLFLNEISNGKDNMLSLIKEKYPDGNDASYNVLSNVIINNFDTIESFMNGTNTELPLGNVSNVMMNNEHGLSGIDSPSNKVMEPGDKFIAEQEKRGFKLEKVIAFHQIGGKEFKAKLSYVFKSFYGTTSNVIAMPRRIANVEGYTESIITDLKAVKAKKGTAKMLAFNNSIISSVLMQNLSIVKEDPLFTKYFEFADNNGKPRISLNKAASRVKSKSINEQENSVIDAFIEELQKKDVVAKFNDLRVGIKFTKNSDGSISPDSRLVDFNVKGINATGMYIDFNSLSFNEIKIEKSNIENKQNLSKELLDAKNTVEYLEFIGSTENDSEYIAAKKKIEEIEKNNINNYNAPQASTNNISKNEMKRRIFGGKAMTKTDNDANMSMHMNEGMEYINRVLGNPKDIVDVVGEGTIFTEAGAAYGLYELGKIKIEANQKGYTNPLVWKHETGHFVFNNISNEKRERLLTAGAIEMVRMGYYTEEQVRTLTDNQIEEWIVKTYQEYGNVDYLYGYMNNETFAGKILNKFKNFVNKLFGVVFADNYLSSFFDAIERGDFRNMEITDTNTVAKAMDKETSEYEVDNEDLNKEPSKKTSKRDAFMEAIGYNDKVKRDVVERSRSYIANESLVNPKNTSVTLMESARNFINTFDQFDFSEDEVNVNGSKVKVPDITPDMVSSLNDGDYDTYAMYIISQHGDYILGELFGNKNLVSTWRHYNETSESRDISMTMSGMFDMVLSAIPYQKLIGNYYTPIQFKYLDPSRVKMLIKNNASDIVALANKSGKNILDVMIEDFYKKASGNLRSADYRQNLYSIAKFLEGHKERIKSMEQQTTEFNLDAYMASLDIFNKIGSTVVSTWNKNGKEYVYENGELKVLKLTSSNLSRMRTQIVDEVSKASLNGDIISDRLFNYLKGSIAKTRYNNRSIGKIYSIDENGLSVNVEGTNIKLIEKVKVKSGVAFRFTVDGRETYINQSRKLFTVLGLDRSRNGNNINSYITKNNSEFDVIQDYVKSYTNEQKDNQLVAEAIYYMMASANQWAEYKKQLNDLDTIKEDIDDYDAKKASLIESLNSGTLDGFNTLKDDIANFMKKMRSKQVDDSKKKNKTIDTSIGVETAGEEQVLNFYNPTDFENFMKLMADLEISGDTKGALPVLYDSKGNRIPAYGISNFMLDASQRGMFMTDQKTPGKIYKEVDGKVVSMHPLSNEVDGFVITDLQKSFMFSDKSSTKTPNSSDLARVSIDEWYNSLIESAGKRVNFSVFDITNRQDHYSYNLNMDKPMIVVNEKEDGKSVFYDKKVIVSKYEKGFEYYANGAQYSANKLNNLLTKYGHGKTIDGYFGKNFNGPKSKYQTMTNELNMALKSYAKEGSKLRLEIMSNLIEGADYIIDKDGNMTIGRSISFDTHSFWNYINYDIINKAKDVDSKFEAITKASQTGYQNLASTLSKHGYKLDDKYYKIIGYDAEGKYVYYKSDKDDKVTNNPLMFGFYLQDQVHRTFFDSLTVSDFTIFPTDVKKSKRKGIVTSNSLVAFYYPGLAKITKLNFLVTASTRGTITVNGKTTNPLNNDGFSRGSLFGKVINELGFGGQFSGEEGAAKKTTLVDQDIVNGGIKMIKHAIEFNTNESYYNSDIVRKLERTFMLSWSDKVEVEFNRIGSNNTFYPYKMFLESLNEGLTPEDATKKIFESIITEYSPEEQDAILNNAYMGQSDESTIKAEMIGKTPYTVEQINDIDKAYRGLDENGKLTMLPSMTLNAESLRFVTNLNQDVSDMEDNVAAQHQFISIATELNTVNEDGSIKRNYSAEIDTILSDLFKRRAKKYQEKINKTSDVNRFVSDSRKAKILNFTRIVAQQSVDNIKGMSNLGTIMNDPKVDVRIPLVSEDMKRMYRGNMDRFVNKTKMNGARCTVLPSNHIALYTINDGKTHWSMRDIETTYGIVFSDKMLDQDIIKVGELEFKKTRAKPMMWDEGKKVQLTEGIIPNPLLQEMNMLPEESLRSIFLIKTRNGRNIDVKDTQDMEIGQVVTLITNSILSMSVGNTTIDGFNPDANEYNTHVFYRNNKAIVDKIMKDGKETGQVDPKDLKTLKIAIKDFYRKWEMVLSEYNQTRIPTGHLGQVDIGRIVMFSGTGNNAYIPGELGVRNDGDFDGDQNQFYIKVATEYVKESEKENREDTIQDLQNKVLDTITEAILDPDNADKIDRSSNVDEIRQLIDKHNKAYDNPISSFGAMLDNAQRAKAGSKGVSIFANLISAYTEILRSPLNPFTNKELEGDISITRNNGNWTQIALDSASNIGIGELGITEQSLPLFAISLVAFDKNIKTADNLNKTIINFFHNDKVKEILRFAEKSSDLDSYYSADTLLRNIYRQNNKIKEEAKGITKKDYNKAVKAYEYAQPELKKLNNERASILKEENLNDLWKEINNKELFERISAKSEYLSSLMDNYKDVPQSQEEKDVNAETLSNFAQVMIDIYSDFNSFDAKAIKRLSENSGSDIGIVAGKLLQLLETINDLYEKINGKKTKIVDADGKETISVKKGYLQIMALYNNKAIVNDMYKKAVLAEQTRRFSVINSLRNDVKNKSDERYAQILEIELALGMTIEDFLSGKKSTLSNHLNFFKTHNNKYLKATSTEDMKMILDIETDIYYAYSKTKKEGTSLSDVIRTSGFSKHIGILQNLKNEYMGYESPHIDDHRLFKETFDRYTSELFAMPTKAQKVAFDKTIKSYILNRYLELKNTTVSLDIYDDTDLINGTLAFSRMEAPSLKNLKLWKVNDAQSFISNLPVTFSFYQRMAKSGDNTLFDNTGGDNSKLLEIVKAFRENEFLLKYTVKGSPNAMYMSIDSDMTLSDDQKKELADKHFSKLPQELKDLIFYYESLRNAYTFKAGSAYDMMPNEVYYDQSQYMDKIISELDDIVANEKSSKIFKKRFVENLMKNTDALSYLPSKDYEEFGVVKQGKLSKLKSSEIVKQKVSPGDGSNTKGYSSLYRDTNINGNDIVVNSDGQQVFATSIDVLYDNDINHDVFTKGIILRALPTDMVRALSDSYVNGQSLSIVRNYAEKKNFKDSESYFTNNGIPLKVKALNKEKTSWEFSVVGNKIKSSNVIKSPILEQIMERAKVNQNDAAQILIDKFAKLMPGTNVFIETEQSAFDKTGRYDKKGWVDVNGIHFVKGQITADTMVHEFTEVWLEYMKRNNYEAYVQVIKMGEQDMVNNKEIVDAIKRSYGFTGVELVTEYIATVSGFNSIDKVKAFMNKNYGPETSINKSEGIMNSVKNFINKLFDAIKSLFGRLSKTPDSKLMNIDFANATFGEVLDAISDDAINGVSVFSEDEGFELKDLMENDEVHFSNVLNPISNLNDFDNAFSRDPLNMDSYTGSSKAEFYYTKLRENKKTGGLFIYYNGKNYQFNNGTKESLIKQIESKLLPDVEAGINTNLDTLDVIFKEMRNREDFIIEAEKLATAENSKLNYASLKKIYDHSGFAYGFEKVVKFSDLKYSNDPQLKMLYEEYTFGKTDPYVIIHGKDASGKLSISLLDLSADNMVGRNVNIKDRNILAAFGVDDRTFMGDGGTFENNVIGIKAFKLALLTAHIAKTNPNIKINNISIFGYPGSIMKYNTISNVESVVKNLTLVGENEKVMGMITNEYLKTLLTDKELHDSINVGTYMDILAQYLGDTTELGDMTNKSTAFIKNNKLNDVPRHELIAAIKKRMKHIERVKKEHVERVSDKEYELLGSTLMELEYRVNRQDLENYSGGDMNRIERLITTYQNQKNPIAQTVITAYRKAKMTIVEDAKKDFKALNVFRDAYYKKYSRSNPAAFTASKIFEASSEIYKQMYQNVEVYRTINGERKLDKIHVPFLIHHDVNNENTKRALASGEIDMTVVEYGEAIMKRLEEKMITSIMFNSEAEGNPISRTRAETLYKNLLRTHDTSKMFGSFVMPVIKKSQAEFMFKGVNKFMKDNKAAREDIKSAISRSFEESGNEYSMFMDVTQEDDANVIESQFTKQIGNFDAVMSLCGMKINVDGTFEIVDEKAFDSISTNVEMASGSFMLATNRKRVYETMFVPIYNTAKVMLIKKGLNDPKKELTNTIKWLDEMFQTLVKRESPDMEGSEKWKNFVKVVKKTMRVYSNLMVGFSTKVGVKSFTIMGLTKVVDSVAYKLANLGVPEENKDQFLKLFDPKNMAQAEKFIITNFHFAWTLARKLQVIDSQEFDLLHNPVYFKTSQNLASDNVAHILNSGGDNLVRVSLAISHLISNGSLDAYSYDPATGEISYDETKDRKYYDKDGKLINAGLREVTYQDNIDIGTQDPANQKLMLGENYRDMDMIKVNTDRFVIGSLSEDARFQLNNMIAGRLVSQFRLFSDEKLFRAGIFASTRKSMIGTGYKFVEDQYGNKVPYVEIKELEGLMQSLGAAFREVIIARNMGVKEFWQTASPERRMNLSRAVVRLIIGGMIFAMLKAALPDEDEETYQVGLTRMKYFNFLYRDMFDLMVLSETISQPIPLVNMVTDMYGVLLNDKEFSTLWKYVYGVKGTIQGTPEMIDMLTQPLEEMDAEYDEEQRIKREEK